MGQANGSAQLTRVRAGRGAGRKRVRGAVPWASLGPSGPSAACGGKEPAAAPPRDVPRPEFPTNLSGWDAEELGRARSPKLVPDLVQTSVPPRLAGNRLAIGGPGILRKNGL